MSLHKCNICNLSTSDVDSIFFGEWMSKSDIVVHYYCLLLSTHLPQNGKDHSGILGFLIPDIRKEIINAQMRACLYCSETGASIMCKKCKKYLHLVCGQTNKCLFQFINEFATYCDSCLPIDKHRLRVVKANPPKVEDQCFICKSHLGPYHQIRHIYGKCCGNGYVHSKCLKKYALSAGYYLICIWCKNKKFRNDVKYQGVFVPDRDANWELEKGAYKDLYLKYRRCDMEECKCPKGRDFIGGIKWQIIICKYCGANGVHNPGCLTGLQTLTEYQCETCSVTEQTICHNSTIIHDNTTTDINNGSFDSSLYTHKLERDLTQNRNTPSIDYSDDSASSVETVVHVQNRITSTINKSLPNSIIPTLTQSEDESTIEPELDKIIATSKNTKSIIDVQKIDDFNEGVMKVIEENCVKKEIIETEATINIDVDVIQKKDQLISDNRTIDTNGGVMKVIDEKANLELMNTNVVELLEKAQTNKDNGDTEISNSNTACRVEENDENIEEIIVSISNAAAYVYPVTNKLITELRKLDPNAAATLEEKQRIIDKLQRNNPYGITEYANSDSDEDEKGQLDSGNKDKSKDESDGDVELDSSEDDPNADVLVQNFLDIFE